MATMNTEAFAGSEFGSQAAVRLRVAFERSRHPMLIADDGRRWVTGNAAACELMGIDREEVPWRTMDDFTPPSERKTLEERWAAFLSTGTAEGWYQFHVPDRGPVPVEFSAIANVLPARHLSVFIPHDNASDETMTLAREAAWTPVVSESSGRLELTEREREVMTLVASGLQSGPAAERLVLSPETVKSHVHNAMGKLGAHTRAHAVAIALVTGQITWDI
jgi:PAS domain S-box-containing protein